MHCLKGVLFNFKLDVDVKRLQPTLISPEDSPSPTFKMMCPIVSCQKPVNVTVTTARVRKETFEKHLLKYHKELVPQTHNTIVNLDQVTSHQSSSQQSLSPIILLQSSDPHSSPCPPSSSQSSTSQSSFFRSTISQTSTSRTDPPLSYDFEVSENEDSIYFTPEKDNQTTQTVPKVRRLFKSKTGKSD